MLSRAAVYAYLLTFIALVAAGLGFPIPEELPIVWAGALVGGHTSEESALLPRCPEVIALLAASPDAAWPSNLPWAAMQACSELTDPPSSAIRLRWWIMLPICILGVVISDGLLYGMGRYFGTRLIELPIVARLLPAEKRRRIEENFHKYGVLVLLFARFLPTIRAPIFVTAGIMRLSFVRFLLADGLYAIPGVSLLFFLAYAFGHQFMDLVMRAEGKVEKLRPLLVLLVIAGIVGYLISHFYGHPVATGDPREEVPLVGAKVAEKIEHPDKAQR